MAADRSVAPHGPMPGFITSAHDGADQTEIQEDMNGSNTSWSMSFPRKSRKQPLWGTSARTPSMHMANSAKSSLRAAASVGCAHGGACSYQHGQHPQDKVGLGSTVRVYDNSRMRKSNTSWVTSEESDVTAGKISTSSPNRPPPCSTEVGDSAVVSTQRQPRDGDSEPDHHPRPDGSQVTRTE